MVKARKPVSASGLELTDLIRVRDVAMLASTDAAVLKSRPVTVIDIDRPDTLWFVVDAGSRFAADIERDQRACLSLISNGLSYLSLRGMCSLTRDLDRIEALWGSRFSLWFDGPRDPQLALLRFCVTSAEQWGAPRADTRLSGARLFKPLVAGDDSALGRYHRWTPMSSAQSQ